jgi:hypothetical protein
MYGRYWYCKYPSANPIWGENMNKGRADTTGDGSKQEERNQENRKIIGENICIRGKIGA